MLKTRPPPKIVQAASEVEHWFAEQGIKRWKLGGVQSAYQPPLIIDNAVDPARPLALETALEYAINKADGRNYVLEGEAVHEPEMTAARALLPWVRWKWREYFRQ